jgi:hypothetical protein
MNKKSGRPVRISYYIWTRYLQSRKVEEYSTHGSEDSERTFIIKFQNFKKLLNFYEVGTV